METDNTHDMESDNTHELTRLSDLLRHALLEIRRLCRQGRAEQAAALADAVHNLPSAMWRPDFDRERLRGDLDSYRQWCDKAGAVPLFDYAALLDGGTGA